MPIYKVKGKKDGLQRYKIRINYISDSGEAKQLTRIAYGMDNAKNLEMRLNNDIKNKQEMPIRKMTIQELFDEYIAIKKIEVKELTIVKILQDFDYYILPNFKNYRIDRITTNMLQDWKIFMVEKNLSLSTKSNAFINFKSIFNYATLMEYIPKNPFSKINNFKDTSNIKKKIEVYTVKEFEKFIREAKKIAKEKEKHQNDFSEWNYYVFFNIAFYTGLRKGEIHALKWSDINGNYLSVKRSVTQRLKGGDMETAPKNKSSVRTLQMPLPLILILGEHKQRQQILHNFTDDFRICNNVRDTTIQRRNEMYSATAGIKTIRIHDFRHTHASVLAYQNINIQEVSRRLGHTRVEITWNTYCHLYPKEEEKAVAILNNFT